MEPYVELMYRQLVRCGDESCEVLHISDARYQWAPRSVVLVRIVELFKDPTVHRIEINGLSSPEQ